jgi:hypothetical protein
VLGAGEEFVVATLRFDAHDKERTLTPETDFRLDGVQALPVGKVGLEAPLAGKLAKGEVRSGPVVFKMTSAQSLTTLVVKGLDRDEKALDVRDPATRTSALLQQLDRAWSGQDWTGAIKALTDLRVIAPDDGIYKDKLYAAYINSADKLTVAGDKGQAAAQLSKAVQLDPTRDEAASRQLALTPTPLPATATPVPAPAAPPTVQQSSLVARPTLAPANPAPTCGAPPNPWGYSFCSGGKVIASAPPDFCSYFSCIASFWRSTNGNVEQCQDGQFSHSGGVKGSCSSHGGNSRPLLSAH